MVKLSEKLSSIVLTFNGEDYLEKCLKNLSRVSDELLVVDSGSSDGSLDIAKKYASKIKYHKFENYGRQCSFAVSKTMNDMVLVVDQDEILSEELIEEIKLLKKNGFQHDGYFIKRDNFLFGKHVKYSGWGNE
ncbi:MAG TPA: glycosyltransferase family 2 protein, partial [Flexistipes sinusarabici]|nr:glycosyltransferase family 2 protein [Flexistipes sinusarabici]